MRLRVNGASLTTQQSLQRDIRAWRELAQRLRALAFLPEVLSLTPRNDTVVHNRHMRSGAPLW